MIQNLKKFWQLDMSCHGWGLLWSSKSVNGIVEKMYEKEFGPSALKLVHKFEQIAIFHRIWH